MIKGNRLVLRAWEPEDVDAFARWFDDPEVTIYLGNAYPAISRDQEQRLYERLSQEKYTYSIVTMEGMLIGNCNLHNVNLEARSAEVGIVIGEKSYWSKGYGREAIGLLLQVAFEGIGLHRVSLLHVDMNERGHRCYLAAGFVEEGRLRQADYIKGQFHDTILMSVLAEEYWAAKQRA
ncbi:MAG: GNAT family N-acetyltransferase [Anaerolineae bacterium]